MNKRDTWYLMKAHHIVSGRQANLTNIIKEQMGSRYTIFLTVTEKGTERYCLSSGHVTCHSIDEKVNWVNDTGRGHREPAYDDSVMVIKNIIHVDCEGKIVSSHYDVSKDNSRRSTVVFK